MTELIFILNRFSYLFHSNEDHLDRCIISCFSSATLYSIVLLIVLFLYQTLSVSQNIIIKVSDNDHHLIIIKFY